MLCQSPAFALTTRCDSAPTPCTKFSSSISLGGNVVLSAVLLCWSQTLPSATEGRRFLDMAKTQLSKDFSLALEKQPIIQAPQNIQLCYHCFDTSNYVIWNKVTDLFLFKKEKKLWLDISTQLGDGVIFAGWWIYWFWHLMSPGDAEQQQNWNLCTQTNLPDFQRTASYYDFLETVPNLNTSALLQIPFAWSL